MFSNNNPKLIEIRDQAAKLQKQKERDERKRQGQERKQKKRNIQLQEDPSIDIFNICTNPAGSCVQLIQSDQTLTFLVVFLYPEYGQTDYIKEFHENTKLSDQLAPTFESRTSWDEEGKYTLDQIRIYFEDHDKHELKLVSSDKTLLEILQLLRFVVQLGMPSLIIMVPNSPFAKHYFKIYETLG